jgi:spore coat protein A
MTRMLTLNEEFDNYGRLKPSLGLGVPVKGKGFGLNYLDPATETPTAGTVEVWQIANLTGDTHPIHFHLVNAQVLARQTFKPQNFKGTPAYIGLPRLPDPDESGWKETVRMHPGEVTTVAMKFTLPEIKTAGGAVIATPVSPRTGGHEYVYHCHILEHEEHDMMRPLVVV